jgi:Ca-activated chloride channel homolog
MVLALWWLLLVWLAVLGGLGAYWWLRHRQHKKVVGLPVANTRRFTSLPLYQQLVRRYKRYVALLTGLVAIALTSAMTLSARPATVTVNQPELRNRDIMLCLDVSGSMVEDDAKIAGTFARLADSFKGERIGLTIFDSSAVVIFPLTDDYSFIKARLQALQKSLTSQDFSSSGDEFDIWNGTTEGDGSSLIGDGLASCALRFDAQAAKRSRSIILATDNGLAGHPIVTLNEAAALAKQKGIRVYGLNPGDFSSSNWVDAVADEYRKAMLLTGGGYYKFTDPSAIPDLITQIQKQEATRFKGAPQLVQRDKPQWVAIVALLTVAGIIGLAWRLDI